MRFLFILSTFLFFQLHSFVSTAAAQIIEPAVWTHTMEPKQAKAGDELTLIFSAVIDDDWYMYSSDFSEDVGPMVTTFTFEANDSYELIGGITPVNPKKKYDEVWEGEYTYFVHQATFKQKVKILKDDFYISGEYEYQVCTDVSGKCIPFDDSFSFGKKPAANTTVIKQDAELDPLLNEVEDEQNASVFGFFLLALGSGLVALLTPCVFPMIPMTVTFFTNSGGEEARKIGIRNAFIFGISIVLIYTIIGTAVAAFIGPEAANFISTHWLPNIFFFAIFMIFALSFLGMFEITLPHQFVNKVNQEANKGGLYGVFFMALTLVVVSFSCTGPIVGSILIQSAGGEILKPIIGMLGFSLAFAIPFTIFAIFPNWLSSLPKSGGWLNTVKVLLGFLEIALGLKFLSVADQTYHWGILDREVYIAIWIATFTLMGLYLIGKLKLPHDSDLPSVSVPRTILAILTFSFVIYLTPGMIGAPLKALAGYLPPMKTHDFALVDIIRQNAGSGVASSKPSDTDFSKVKYADLFELPHGLKGYFDYDEAMAAAKKEGKPLFIDFTGHGCVNCREMEANVWAEPEVLKRLNNDFVIVALYVDDKTELDENQWYTSEYDGKVKKTIGKQNADFQITKFRNNAQPYYCLLDHNGKLLVKPKAYDLNVQNFVDFLDKAKAEFEKRQ